MDAHSGPVFAMYTSLEDGLIVSGGKEKKCVCCVCVCVRARTCVVNCLCLCSVCMYVFSS